MILLGMKMNVMLLTLTKSRYCFNVVTVTLDCKEALFVPFITQEIV